MGKEPVGPPPDEETRDTAEAIVRASVGMTPFVGGPLAELANVMMEKALPRRKDAWLKKVGETVDYLTAHSIDIEGLADNEAFVTVLQEASEAAAKTHEEEKLRALRNAVTRSGLAIGPDEHTKVMYVRYISEFTALHLQILAYLRDPTAWFQTHGIARPSLYAGSRSILLETAFPELKGRGEFYMQIVRDLEARGLAQTALTVMVTEAGLWQGLTRPAGDQFLDFISDPAP